MIFLTFIAVSKTMDISRHCEPCVFCRAWQSKRPFWSNSPRNCRQILSHVPSSSHSRKRRQHVLGLGYLSGRSFQRAPVLSIQRMPSKHRRSLSGGRPPRLSDLRLGSRASMDFHCLSVTARQAIEYLHDLVSYRIKITCQPV